MKLALDLTFSLEKQVCKNKLKVVSPLRLNSERSSAVETFEQRVLFSTYVVNTLSDAISPGNGLLTLRQAVAAANTNSGANLISFDPKVFAVGSEHTIQLTQGQMEFNNKKGITTVDGPGDSVLAVNGDEKSRIFLIASGASVYMSGLTITGGDFMASNGLLATGGGIQNSGILNLTAAAISDNTAEGENYSSTGTNGYGEGGGAEGGGIYNAGTLSINESTIVDDSAVGGSNYTKSNLSPGTNIGFGGGFYSSGILNISGCTISGNEAVGGDGMGLGDDGGNAAGGAIYASGALEIDTTSLSTNEALGGAVSPGDNGAAGSGGSAEGGALYSSAGCSMSDDILNNNQAVGGQSGANGGAAGLAWGGGVFSSGEISLSFTTVENNQAAGNEGPTNDQNAGSDAYGGGVAATGSLTLLSSVISSNTALAGSGGAIVGEQEASAYGGGVYSAQSLRVVSSTVSGNVAQAVAGDLFNGGDGGNGEGGGIYASGQLNMSASSVTNNSADGGAGDQPTDGSGGNGGQGEGGGILSDGTASILNSTLADNDAAGGNGAGFGIDLGIKNGGNGGDGSGSAIYSTGQLALQDSTLSGNAAFGGAGGQGNINYSDGSPGAGLGAIKTATGTPVVNNSIISGNDADAISESDVVGTLSVSSSHNLIGVGGGLINNVNGNIIGKNNPDLSQLGNYGGLTETLIPLSGSPAINAGDVRLIPTGVNTDQRGFPRTTEKTLDIGADEFGNAALTGTVFNDEYATGQRQSGDPGLDGFTVYLDLNHDGQFDSGDISDITNSAGEYSFAKVPAGNYSVGIVIPRSYRLTYPLFLPKQVTVTSGAAASGPAFGLTQDALLSGSVINSKTGLPLSGCRVFLDVNNDGKWEPTEASVLTTSSGSWSFNIGNPGIYRVRIVSKSGYKTVAPTDGVFTFDVGKASARIGNVFKEQQLL